MKNIITGDFGVSLKTGERLDYYSDILLDIAKLGGIAAAVAIFVGEVLGSIAALTEMLRTESLSFLNTVYGGSSFVLATLLLLVFSITLAWVPVWSTSQQNYILPVISLAMYPMAYITRLTKSSMLDALGQDYVRTARAKGVKRILVIFKHTLRNALIPVVTYVGPMVAYILTGSLVVENVFTIGGLGSKFITSISNRDYTMIMATTIFLAVLMVIANLISDLYTRRLTRASPLIERRHVKAYEI